MRVILLSIAFLFLAFSAQSQVLKSAGVWYFLDVDSMTARPAVLPNGTELAYVVGTKTVYYWNRNTSTWTAYGSTFGRDSIYFDASIVGSGTVSDPWGVDSTLFATIAAVGDSIAAALLDYVEIADTAAMLLNYPSTTVYGIIDGGKTWRADTTSPNGLATRLFAKTLPTSILTGQVVYSNGSNLVGSANHFWDNTNVRLGIGTNAPANILDIYSSSSSVGVITNIVSDNNAQSARYRVRAATNSSNFLDIGKLSSGVAVYKTIAQSDAFLYNASIAGDISILNDFSTGKIKFATAGSGTAQMTLAATGNLLIGTTTDVPTSILTARSTTKSSSPFPLHTLAESDAITGVQGNFDYETTQNGLRWHNGTRKAYALESTFARGTQNYVPYFDANGQLTQNIGLRFDAAKLIIAVPGGTLINGSYTGTASVGVAIGGTINATNSTESPIAIGSGSSVTASRGIALGLSATAANGVAIGRESIAGTNEFVMGARVNNSNGLQITALRFGVDANGTTPGAFRIISQGGAFGANQTGGGFGIYTGAATGAAKPGSFGIYTPALLASGSTLQSTYTPKFLLDGQTQQFQLGTTATAGSSALDISNVNLLGSRPFPVLTTTQRNALAGRVISATFVSAGGSYTSAPTVSITGGGGSGATAVATIQSGGVIAVTIINQGSGYTSTPTIGFSGGGGSGANFTAVTTNEVDGLGIYNSTTKTYQYYETTTNTWRDFGSYQSGSFGNVTAPARTLHIAGEARITDLTTDSPTQIVGADADGDLGAIAIASDFKLASGTL